MLGQQQRAGFEDHDLEAMIGQFDRHRNAARAAADDQAIDGAVGDRTGIAEQDGSQGVHHSAAFSREANALPTFQKAAIMSSTSLSVSTEATVSSAARSDSESHIGRLPLS